MPSLAMQERNHNALRTQDCLDVPDACLTDSILSALRRVRTTQTLPLVISGNVTPIMQLVCFQIRIILQYFFLFVSSAACCLWVEPFGRCSWKYLLLSTDSSVHFIISLTFVTAGICLGRVFKESTEEKMLLSPHFYSTFRIWPTTLQESCLV